ncbi:beta-propeller fold lactonase family protein [Neobacillus cucumis]|uniref:beta-propeller fold lactonase family protein n=1 Tax=Neobacillus cucumis TaxID=1740721 RepID=UPI001965E631|nr:beta-propeller fold lactonase family protein [Neobacillus cucumis]MBM7656138.1 6-phosphogluconolactonase (cycloisomerase 2 family) [Neobacillus cucumis]
MVNDTFVYIGNWKNNGSSCGFGICKYDEKRGELEYQKNVFPEICIGATYLDKKRNILYCTDERSHHPDFGHGGGGRVYALAINSESGDLVEINHKPTYALLASYVTTDRSGNYLIVTNHSGDHPVTKSVRDAAGNYHIVLEFEKLMKKSHNTEIIFLNLPRIFLKMSFTTGTH